MPVVQTAGARRIYRQAWLVQTKFKSLQALRDLDLSDFRKRGWAVMRGERDYPHVIV
jgi:hypothetical protein